MSGVAKVRDALLGKGFGMASRNERKRRAKARRLALQAAVAEAFKAEASRQRQAEQAGSSTADEYPFYDGLSKYDALRFTHCRGSSERHGIIVRGGRSKLGKFKARAPEPEPWDSPTKRTFCNSEGIEVVGERRKRYVA